MNDASGHGPRSRVDPLRAVRRGLLVGVVLLLGYWIFGGSSAGPWSPIEKRRDAHMRVVWTEDPAHEATILWSTSPEFLEGGEDPETDRRLLLYDSPPGSTGRKLVREVDAVESERFPDPDEDRIEVLRHRVDLTDLEPQTSYWLAVSSNLGRGRDFWFRTAPDDDRAVTILSGGDCLDRRPQRRAMNVRMRMLVEQDPQILCLAHAGDFVRNGTSLEEWLEWLDDHEELTGPDGQLLPIIPARGNHESTGPLFDFVFADPGGAGRNYYLTRLGLDVALLTLNTEAPAEGDQRKFLEEALEASQEQDFRLAQYHAGMYPAVRKPAAAREVWLPLFDRYGLDFGLESNGHTLKRTPPIRGEQVDPAGTVFLGEGGLGAKQRSPSSDEERSRFWTQQPGGFVARGDHVWKLRFENGTATARAILADGRIADTFRRNAR